MGGLFSTPTVSTSDTRLNSMRIQQSAYGLCQPLIYGTTRVSANLLWYNNFRSHAITTTTKSGGKGGGGSKTKHTSYVYTASLMMAISETPIEDILIVWKDKNQILPVKVNGVTWSPIDQLKLELFNGRNNSTWPYLLSKYPNQALSYRYLAFVAASDYDLGAIASLLNHSFEVKSFIRASEDLLDANPADIISDFIRHPRYGAAPSLVVNNLREFRAYCGAANLFFSPAMIEQRDATEIIEELVEAANCAIVPTADGFTIRSYGDSALSANGYNFVPDLKPKYYLTDDDFLGDTPLSIKRSRDTDAYNHVQIEYCNRYNQYNPEPMPADDQANIEQFGLRSEDVINYQFICDPKIAKHVAQLRLQKKLYVRNEYSFQLGWNYCLLEPMDILSLSSEVMGLSNLLVRVTQVDEDDEGLLSFTAEELAIGSRSAISYNLQSANGYQGGSNDPGNVYAPAIFEPPLYLTNGAREVWIAAAGGIDWGGATVWVSLDNLTYEAIGYIYGSARYGSAKSALSESETFVTVELNTDGQVLSGTQLDADTDTTLICIGDEFMSYVEADLVALNTYTLSSLQRGKFDAIESHAINERFVRLDKAIFKYPYLESMDGRTVYFKFTSFNGLQEQEQGLEETTAYPYVLKGGQPSSISGLSLQSAFIGTSFTVQWLPSVGAQFYKVKISENGVLKREVTTAVPQFTYTNEDAILDGLGRDYVISVANENQGNISVYTSTTASNPMPAKMTNIYTTPAETEISVNWNPVDDLDLKDYAVWISTDANLNPLSVPPSWTGTALATVFKGLPTTTIHYIWVCARDIWEPGNWILSDRRQVTTGN